MMTEKDYKKNLNSADLNNKDKKENKPRKQIIINLKQNNNVTNKEDNRMKFKFMGIGAAGNKAAMDLIVKGVAIEEDVILVNSTDKDIPKDFTGNTIILSPTNSGCGKERAISKEYAIAAMKSGTFDDIFGEADSVLIVTSVEGGTGSGSTPIIAEYISKVLGKNIHIVAFTGFEEDVRGLQNTVEFFKEIDFEADVQSIRNAAFMPAAKNNKFKAEKMANEEFVKRTNVLIGTNLQDSSQNIDDTDIFKVVSTTGYKTIETIHFNDNLVDVDEFDRLCKQMIYNSKSLKSENGQLRMGVILNIRPESEDAIDSTFKIIKEAYGMPYECFHHVQYDGGEQYITFISSGMKMPLKEVQDIHERYLKATSSVDKKSDDFFSEVSKLQKAKEDSKFDMVRSSELKSTTDKKGFFKKFETRPNTTE